MAQNMYYYSKRKGWRHSGEILESSKCKTQQVKYQFASSMPVCQTVLITMTETHFFSWAGSTAGFQLSLADIPWFWHLKPSVVSKITKLYICSLPGPPCRDGLASAAL